MYVERAMYKQKYFSVKVRTGNLCLFRFGAYLYLMPGRGGILFQNYFLSLIYFFFPNSFLNIQFKCREDLDVLRKIQTILVYVTAVI